MANVEDLDRPKKSQNILGAEWVKVQWVNGGHPNRLRGEVKENRGLWGGVG